VQALLRTLRFDGMSFFLFFICDRYRGPPAFGEQSLGFAKSITVRLVPWHML
jgi:hypothetical protein